MFDRIQLRALELLNRFSDLKNNERGQTSAEYVAVTAVAVSIAIAVIYATLGASLTTAVSNIGTKITTFVSSPPAIP